jgi:hypothetical protein
VLAGFGCVHASQLAAAIDEPDNPTLEAMEHGGAALLKAMLTEAARYCLEDFRKRTLGLYQ